MNNISQAEIYRAAKNVIHNDLNITKEYIDEVIKKTVQDEIQKLMGDECFIRGLVEKEIAFSLRRKDKDTWHLIYDITSLIKEDVERTICDTVKDKLEIKLKS